MNKKEWFFLLLCFITFQALFYFLINRNGTGIVSKVTAVEKSNKGLGCDGDGARKDSTDTLEESNRALRIGYDDHENEDGETWNKEQEGEGEQQQQRSHIEEKAEKEKEVGQRVGEELEEDLLDDWKVFDGFPKEPLTIEMARICDESFNIMLKGAWKCPVDPTCVQCRKAEIARFKELSDAYYAPDVKEERDSFVKEHFGEPTAGRPVVVMGVNFGQLYLLLNWACASLNYDIDPKTLGLVVPTDDGTYKVLQSFGIPALSTQWTRKLKTPIESSYHGSANTGGHAAINHIILFTVNDLVQKGYEVIMQDVDVVWSRDIRPWLYSAGKRRDLIAQLAPYWDAKGIVNSGFIYIRPTRMSTIFLQSLVAIAPLKQTSDQQLWNVMLRHLYFGQLSYRVLPQRIFYKYSGRRAPRPTNEMLIYHAVGVDKRKHMEWHGMWFYNEKCPFYDSSVSIV